MRRGEAITHNPVMAADETGKRRYNRKELTQNVIKSLSIKVDIKSFTRKRGLLEGSKNMIL